MPFLPPNQQRQSTEGMCTACENAYACVQTFFHLTLLLCVSLLLKTLITVTNYIRTYPSSNNNDGIGVTMLHWTNCSEYVIIAKRVAVPFWNYHNTVTQTSVLQAISFYLILDFCLQISLLASSMHNARDM